MYPLSILRQTITVTRKSGGSYNDVGRWVEGTAQTLTHTRTSVQPADARDLKMLPEGERTDGAIVIYDIEELRPSVEGTSQEADIVNYKGSTYKVVKVDPWLVNRLEHYQALAVLERNT